MIFKQQDASAVLMLIIILFVVPILVISISTMLVGELKMTSIEENRMSSFYTAEAGTEFVINQLDAGFGDMFTGEGVAGFPLSKLNSGNIRAVENKLTTDNRKQTIAIINELLENEVILKELNVEDTDKHKALKYIEIKTEDLKENRVLARKDLYADPNWVWENPFPAGGDINYTENTQFETGYNDNLPAEIFSQFRSREIETQARRDGQYRIYHPNPDRVRSDRDIYHLGDGVHVSEGDYAYRKVFQGDYQDPSISEPYNYKDYPVIRGGRLRGNACGECSSCRNTPYAKIESYFCENVVTENVLERSGQGSNPFENPTVIYIDGDYELRSSGGIDYSDTYMIVSGEIRINGNYNKEDSENNRGINMENIFLYAGERIEFAGGEIDIDFTGKMMTPGDIDIKTTGENNFKEDIDSINERHLDVLSNSRRGLKDWDIKN